MSQNTITRYVLKRNKNKSGGLYGAKVGYYFMLEAEKEKDKYGSCKSAQKASLLTKEELEDVLDHWSDDFKKTILTWDIKEIKINV